MLDSDRRYFIGLDSLRCLAVISVLVYHLNLNFGLLRIFSAGFLGVDIFIVLSGYLIFRNLLSYPTLSKENIWDFTQRRILRIYPSIIFLLLILTPLSLVFLFTDELIFNAKSFLFAIGSLANFYYLTEINYWSPNQHEITFLHTWSLSLEEQFYLFALCVMVILSALKQSSKIVPVICICLIASFSANFMISEKMAFYTLAGRIWEFALGAMICFLPRPQKYRLLTSFIKYVSLFACIMMLLTLKSNITHPQSIWSIIFALNSALLIYTIILCEGKLSPIKFLDTIGAWFGKRSYSIYLYHWPLICYATMLGFELFGPLDKIVLFFSSIILGCISYTLIEVPFRYKMRKAKALKILAGISIALIFMNSLILYKQGFPDRWPSNKTDERHNAAQKDKTIWNDVTGFPFKSAGHGSKHIYLIGDSHAGQYADHLVSALDLEEYTVFNLANGHRIFMCDALHFGIPKEKHMNQFLEDRRKFLKTISNGLIIVAGSYQIALDYHSRYINDTQKEFTKAEFLECYNKALLSLTETNLKTLFFLPVPLQSTDPINQYRLHVGKNLRYKNRQKTAESLTVGYPLKQHLEKNTTLIQETEKYESPDFILFHPEDILCPNDLCASIIQGNLTMTDGQHLSEYSEHLVIQKLLPTIDNAFHTP